jgi:hypothetical protein
VLETDEVEASGDADDATKAGAAAAGVEEAGPESATADKSAAFNMPLRFRASTRSWSSASGEALRIWLASAGAKIPFFTRTSKSAATFALATGAGLEDEFLFVELSPPSFEAGATAGALALVVSSACANRGVTERHASSKIHIQRVSLIEIRVSSAGTLG